MDFIAIQKYLISSPRKLREVVYMIKGLAPDMAVEKLPFTGKKASLELRKVIMTAIANAKQKDVSPSDLIFKEIQINEGPRLKRFRAGARGRAKPYKKRMSHIRVVLTVKEKEVLENKKIESKNSDIKNEKKIVTEKVSKKEEIKKNK